MSIRPVSTTMGVSTPATVAEDAGAGGYKYRKDPDWVPGDPRYREAGKGGLLPQNVKAAGARQRRMAEYNRLRLEDVPKEQAAEQVGIRPSTMHYYEREFVAEHPQEPQP